MKLIASKQSTAIYPSGRSDIIFKKNVFTAIFISYLYCMSVNAASSEDGGDDGFFHRLANTSKQAKEEQPHWITPLATVTPRLEQEFRYDQYWQSKRDSVSVTNYGGGKGLELIPTENTEFIIGVPPYFVKDTAKGTTSGWGDESITVKYRMLSANEEQGNYIVTGFLGVSLPSGDTGFSNDYTIYTPTLAFGKGWGSRESGFDIQSTVGISIPNSNRESVGIPLVWNTALQMHVFKKLWPEVEVNYTHWTDGPNNEKTQVAITTGLVLGRIQLSQDLNLIVGTGYQQPVSAFRTYEHAWVGTVRMAF